MSWRLLAFVSIISAPLQAHALNACFVESAGKWTGPINEGGIAQLDTTFTVNPDATLAGTYTVHDASPYHGTLTGFQQTGTCTAVFTWHDKYGTGFVTIRFAPEQGRFDGMWGAPNPVPQLIFDGFRSASAPLA
jgi:hypothetical protein